MKCPKCQSELSSPPDAAGSIVCPGCGARLRARPTPVGAIPSRERPAVPNGLAPQTTRAASGFPMAPPDPRPGADTARVKVPVRLAGGPPSAGGPVSLEALMNEVREVKALAEEAVALLRSEPKLRTTESDDDSPFGMGAHLASEAAPATPIRARRRKTVLLIDDDAATREAAKAALEKAEVPTRIALDGNAGLAAIAQEKPDVIVLELGMSGAMAGKDVINMIKATMEWVDVPIVLYTRMRIESQKEARQIHGADEIVLKDAAGPETLVARVISIFRRG